MNLSFIGHGFVTVLSVENKLIILSIRVVKLISPKLNYVMIFGAFLLVLTGLPYRPTDIPARIPSCLVHTRYMIMTVLYANVDWQAVSILRI